MVLRNIVRVPSLTVGVQFAHEFVNAINEDREPFPNDRTAANWTCVGLFAHESSMNKGERIDLPDFTMSDE